MRGTMMRDSRGFDGWTRRIDGLACLAIGIIQKHSDRFPRVATLVRIGQIMAPPKMSADLNVPCLDTIPSSPGGNDVALVIQ
jgi:hypothetical protein